MKFDIRDFKDIKEIIKKNDITPSSLISDDIINSIMDDIVDDAVRVYLNSGSKILMKICTTNFNANYESIKYTLNDGVYSISKAINPDRMVKIKALLNQDDLPNSIHIMGFKYTNLKDNLNIGYAFIYSLIPMLDDINAKLTDIVVYHEDDGVYEKNIQLEKMINELNNYINNKNHKKIITETMLNHRNYDSLKFNDKYFRNGTDKESDIIIKKEDYKDLYYETRGFKDYRHTLISYNTTYSKFHDVVISTMDNRRVLKLYDMLPKDEPFRRNIAKVFMLEGKLAFIYSKIINEMLIIQMKAMIESMSQNTTAYNTIYENRNK